MKSNRIMVLVLACLLLTGCKGFPASDGSVGEQSPSGSGKSAVTVYAEAEYRYALQQVFSYINMSESSLEILWTGEKSSADVVITDCVPQSDYSLYRPLDTKKLNIQGAEAFALRTQQGIIGLPLFLHVNGFWYDELLYTQQQRAVPQSRDTWLSGTLSREYPAVCDRQSMEALFWSMVAPLYLAAGGTDEELAAGQLQAACLQPALEQVAQAVEDRYLLLTADARQKFTDTEAAFWLADGAEVAKSYNLKSNLSRWGISLSVSFGADQQAQSVAWADMLLIRSTAEKEVTDRFLQLFYTEKVLADLSEDTKMPMACRMNYIPSVVPEPAKTCYTALSSPAMELCCIVCGWSEETRETVETTLLHMIDGAFTVLEATEQICGN